MLELPYWNNNKGILVWIEGTNVMCEFYQIACQMLLVKSNWIE